ncbi:MAG: Gfo/Idh/MocA family oxidoreductase [Candidatus Jordarchaeales archaeon]
MLRDKKDEVGIMLGVGVVGVGFWGKQHARNFASIEKTKLVAVCDVREEEARKVGKTYGVDWYTDLDEFLRREDMDAVSICTPTSAHFEVATKSILSGKHVLLEKPMTADVEKALKLVEYAKEQGVFLMIGFIERFNPGVLRVIKVLKSGVIGDPVMSISRRVGPYWPDRVKDVGVVSDSAIHDIDLARYIFRSEIASVYAVGGRLKHRFEDYVAIMLHLTNGLSCVIEANWLTPRKKRELIITGEKGIIKLDNLSQKISIESDEWEMSSSAEWEEPLRKELEYFAECIIERKQPYPSGEDGVKALQVINAVLESMKQKKVVELNW